MAYTYVILNQITDWQTAVRSITGMDEDDLSDDELDVICYGPQAEMRVKTAYAEYAACTGDDLIKLGLACLYFCAAFLTDKIRRQNASTRLMDYAETKERTDWTAMKRGWEDIAYAALNELRGITPADGINLMALADNLDIELADFRDQT